MFTFIIKIWYLKNMFHRFCKWFWKLLELIIKINHSQYSIFKWTPSLSPSQSCQSELSTANWWFPPQHFLLVCLLAFRLGKARQKSGLTFFANILFSLLAHLLWRGPVSSRRRRLRCEQCSISFLFAFSSLLLRCCYFFPGRTLVGLWLSPEKVVSFQTERSGASASIWMGQCLSSHGRPCVSPRSLGACSGPDKPDARQ